MPRKSEDTTFEEGQVVAIPVKGEAGEELRPALITNVGGDGTTNSQTINYAFIEADGGLGLSGHAQPYQTKGWKHLDFCKVRTVVDMPPDWTKVATEFDRRYEENLKRSVHDDDWEPERHPSYGVVTVGRIQGFQSLFMSPFTHQHSMRLTVRRAVKHRGLSNDHTSTAGEVRLLEIGLSEAQWARLLSSVGNGEGVPCTLAYVGGQQMPECPQQVEVEKFHEDIKQAQEKAAALLKEAEELANALLADKAPTKAKREDLRDRIHFARRKLTESMPFIAKQMHERIEHIVAEGKTEIEAFAQKTLQQAGLERLLGTKVAPPIDLLPAPPKKDGDS